MTLYGMSDIALLEMVGSRLKTRRLNRNLTQREVAERAGIDRTTVGEIERGASSSTMTLVRILRVLDSLDDLDTFLPDPGPSPLQLAKLQGKTRQRASRPRSSDDEDTGVSE